MSLSVHPSIRKLFHPGRFRSFRKPWDRVAVAKLPTEYQKFYTEWMDSLEKETPVHWIPREEKWERNPETGEVKDVQNEPIHVNYPVEMHLGLWGGEGVVQGTVKKGKWRSPVPRFWSPQLERTIVYSEILDKYLSVVVTKRALRLIDQYNGLDNYLLTTPAYDLKSLLALKLKRQIMLSLVDKGKTPSHITSERKAELLQKYKEYLIPRNELEWYGLSVDEAIEKEKQIKESSVQFVPLKHKLRMELLKQLKDERDSSAIPENDSFSSSSNTWISKLNPFSKRE